MTCGLDWLRSLFLHHDWLCNDGWLFHPFVQHHCTVNRIQLHWNSYCWNLWVLAIIRSLVRISEHFLPLPHIMQLWRKWISLDTLPAFEWAYIQGGHVRLLGPRGWFGFGGRGCWGWVLVAEAAAISYPTQTWSFPTFTHSVSPPSYEKYYCWLELEKFCPSIHTAPRPSASCPVVQHLVLALELSDAIMAI